MPLSTRPSLARTDPPELSPIVYVVDDDASCLRATCRLLSAAGFAVRAFASSEELLSRLPPRARGCVIVDVMMPGRSGHELQAALAESGVTLPVVFLTGQAHVAGAVRAMREGAVDYLSKDAPAEQLLGAVQSALQRDRALGAEQAKKEALRRRFASLTERERQVLALVVLGKMNKEIAAELQIHERTVKLHRMAVTTKVRAQSVAELTTLFHEAALSEMDRPMRRSNLPQRAVPSARAAR